MSSQVSPDSPSMVMMSGLYAANRSSTGSSFAGSNTFGPPCDRCTEPSTSTCVRGPGIASSSVDRSTRSCFAAVCPNAGAASTIASANAASHLFMPTLPRAMPGLMRARSERLNRVRGDAGKNIPLGRRNSRACVGGWSSGLPDRHGRQGASSASTCAAGFPRDRPDSTSARIALHGIGLARRYPWT